MRALNMFLGVALMAAVLAWPVLSEAQQAAPSTPVTATGARGDAATRCDAVSGSGQQTLTLVSPGAGQSNYITYLAIWGVATGVPTAATPTPATMTGVAGTTPSLSPLASVYPAAGAQGSVSGGPVPLISPIKGSTSTSIAIVGPSAITNMNQIIEACYYSAP